MERFQSKKHTRGSFTISDEPWKDKLNLEEPLGPVHIIAVLLVCFSTAYLVLRAHESLPPSLDATAPTDVFSGERAHSLLLQLVAEGPRVAGSAQARAAADRLEGILKTFNMSTHHRISVERYSGSGEFPLHFLDGFTNIYRGASSVVAKIGPRRHESRSGPRPALLLNCHYDTVPDSPGGSDDGAGCAVVLESARALAAGPALPRDLVVLLNGAEENMMQAAHAWVSGHRWAKRVRAFVNVEACGAGGREVLFQAGPRRSGALLAAYGAAPRPFASSLAQDIFQSGLLPADTDFRVFRDAGGLSGLDLAWSANGYVYHTALDEASRVPRAALQRTGDNVLALARELLHGAALERDETEREDPVFFDVLGLRVVLLSRGQATAAAITGLALLAMRLRARAGRGAAKAVGRLLLAGFVGAGAAFLLALGMRAVGCTMSWYSRPWLLWPLYALPAWGVCGLTLRGRSRRGRLWAAFEEYCDAQLVWWATVTAACACLGLRSGFLAALWSIPPLVTWSLRRWLGGGEPWWWVAGSLLGAAQTWYLSMASLQLLVPIMGRAGSRLPAEEVIGVLTAVLFMASAGWLYPLLLVTRGSRTLLWSCVFVGLLTALMTACGCTPYSSDRPQRIMIFHTTRTVHYKGEKAPSSAYWSPSLDANTARTLHREGGGVGPWRDMDECEEMLYCGAPYYLPVTSFISHALWSRRVAPPVGGPRLSAVVHARPDSAGALLTITIKSAPPHVSLVISPCRDFRIARVHTSGGDKHTHSDSPVPGPRWRGRETYFFLLHQSEANASGAWNVTAELVQAGTDTRDRSLSWADVSVAGHCLWGDCQTDAATHRLRAEFPEWSTVTGWAVDLHLYRA